MNKDHEAAKIVALIGLNLIILALLLLSLNGFWWRVSYWSGCFMFWLAYYLRVLK